MGSPPPPGPHRSHPPSQQIDSDLIGSSGAILSSDILACSGCGAVFKASKLTEKAPSARMIPNDLKNVTCPVCLATPGWEFV